MGEFTSRVRECAAEAMRQVYGQQVPREADPLVDLISQLLEDGAGGVSAPAKTPVTAEEWLTWNDAALYRPDELTETLTKVLDREQTELPSSLEAMRVWAASLLAMTLDELQMR